MKPETRRDQVIKRLIDAGRFEVDTKTGVIYSVIRKRVGFINFAGYRLVCFGNTQYMVHRMVWMKANGAIPEGYEVNHKNGDKSDNRLENLELVTRAENINHAVKVLGKTVGIYGKKTIGENNGHSTFTNQDVETIRSLLAAGNSQASIARLYGVTRTAVHSIYKGKTWKHV